MTTALMLAGLGGFTAPTTTLEMTAAIGKKIGPSPRAAIRIDPIERMIAEGPWKSPKASVNGWSTLTPNKDGWIEGGPTEGGYVVWKVPSDRARIMCLVAQGDTMVYVNGVPRAGDPYGYGYLSLPVELKRGENEFIFACGRGRLKARLEEPKKSISILPTDMTLPDLRPGTESYVAGVVIQNASKIPCRGLSMRINGAEVCPIPDIPAMSIRKVPVQFAKPARLPLLLELRDAKTTFDSATIQLDEKPQTAAYKRTFISNIDGTAQYYAVQPSSTGQPDRALVLSLHGASVEAIGQAQSYAAKPWCDIVCPTNRRPYGFDWEDIGRRDAMEVLNLHQTAEFNPNRTYLTGHSMGGHGSWQLGATYPDRFAAIGPSAGWISFASYLGAKPSTEQTPAAKILNRAGNQSNTLLMKQNYAGNGIYILHGDADDNVPVTEARTMMQELAPFHRDFRIHEEKGANHWWDNNPEPGADCTDWAEMFDFFARRALPELDQQKFIDFTTIDPGISSDCYWLSIHRQLVPMTPSHVSLRLDSGLRSVTATTENVSSLSIAPPIEKGAIKLVIDKQTLELAIPARVQLRDGKWELEKQPPLVQKDQHHPSGFKSILAMNPILVTATGGSNEINRWTENKARFDAETYYYRGNGAYEIMSDQTFMKLKFQSIPPRGVIFYGNTECNLALKVRASQEKISIGAKGINIGPNSISSSNQAILMMGVGRDDQRYAIIGGTDLVGMRLTERVPIFSSGVGIPDVLIFGPDALTEGVEAVTLAGFFGINWTAEHGEFVRGTKSKITVMQR